MSTKRIGHHGSGPRWSLGWLCLCLVTFMNAGWATDIFLPGEPPVGFEKEALLWPPPNLELSLAVPEQAGLPRQPLIASFTIANPGPFPFLFPAYPHPRSGVIRLVVEKPDGSVSEPFDLEGCATEGVPFELQPGDRLSDAIALQFDANGGYLFDQEGVYTLAIWLEFEPEEPHTAWLASNQVALQFRSRDDVANPLLEDPQVRRLMALEGGMHLEGAIENLLSVEAMAGESAYAPLATYYLGIAYLRAGGRLCDPEMPEEVLAQGMERLHAALWTLGAESPYLRKRGAWWLARCYDNLGNIRSSSETRGIFDGIGLPFEAREAAMIGR